MRINSLNKSRAYCGYRDKIIRQIFSKAFIRHGEIRAINPLDFDQLGTFVRPGLIRSLPRSEAIDGSTVLLTFEDRFRLLSLDNVIDCPSVASRL
jgi:hypothetical protein